MLETSRPGASAREVLELRKIGGDEVALVDAAAADMAS